MTTDEINRYIHVEIMGKCWHDIQVSRTVPDGFAVKRCSICQATNFSTPLENPRYCSDESPRSLLDEVVARVLHDLKCDPFFAGLHKALAPPYGIGSSCSPLEVIKASAEPIARAAVAAHQHRVEGWKAKKGEKLI